MSDAEKKNTNRTALIALIGGILLALILVGGTLWMGQSAHKDTVDAVRSVSLLYLDELAGRREQVVEDNLNDSIKVINVAIEMIGDEDLSDLDHMRKYQRDIKQLFDLKRFAFVDSDSLVYTSDEGIQNDIDEYAFDPQTLTGPEISIKNPNDKDKKVVIAVPIKDQGLSINGKQLIACFMEIDMDVMLKGASMDTQGNGATFCNIYTSDGVALSNTVLGGLAEEDNLLEALERAQYEDGYSAQKVAKDFSEANAGVTSFTYNGIRETLSYVPVKGTDWLLTYLIRESVISERIDSLSNGIIRRSLIQSVLTLIVLLAVFALIISQNRKNARLLLEKETAEAENRVKQQEMKRRLALQDELLEQRAQQEEQEKMITALASDFRSVYYVELDNNEGVCYQARTDLDGLREGDHFKYLEAATAYCDRYVLPEYREEFMRFVQPDAIREGLKEQRVISHRYMVNLDGTDSYEAVRFAGVRHPEDRDDHMVHAVSAGFTNVDAETRKEIAAQHALSDALSAAEQANKAKTAFLSNMSHEIRTPMNAIIGLDSIALKDPETPEQTREYLEQIGTSAEHLLNLINDILDMSRIESGRMTLRNEEFSFAKLLEAINTLFSAQCRDKGLEYLCRINSEVDDYYIGDSMKLRQALINILGNAVKFTPVGGSVTLQVERKAQFDGKSTLEFKVTDTGIGISADYLPHLFDSFTQEDASATNKYGSSGLGMAITKNIVELMNGNIEVESVKGEGSTFTVTVTLSDAAHVSGSDEVQEIHPSEMTVLVVDDDPLSCEHASLVLEKAGIASEIATSGAEALEMVELRQARRDPYNLILVDWQMPEMDGVETARRIRAITSDSTAIIILTAYNWDDILDEALQAGVDSIIAKPLFAAAVIEEFGAARQRKKLAAKEQTKKAELSGRRILLAEDVKVNAKIMTMVLEARNMEVDLAINGKIAVEKMDSSPEGWYSAILMDIRMPEMDGLEATRQIRAMDRADAALIPIVALTANAFDEDVQRSLQAGMNAHLSKPVKPDALYETLENLIRE